VRADQSSGAEDPLHHHALRALAAGDDGAAAPDTAMRDLWMAAVPFMRCSLVPVALSRVVPGIAPWLPGR
jgi:hypothetical protein